MVYLEEMRSWVQHQVEGLAHSLGVNTIRLPKAGDSEISVDYLWPSLALSQGQVIRNQLFSRVGLQAPSHPRPRATFASITGVQLTHDYILSKVTLEVHLLLCRKSFQTTTDPSL